MFTLLILKKIINSSELVIIELKPIDFELRPWVLLSDLFGLALSAFILMKEGVNVISHDLEITGNWLSIVNAQGIIHSTYGTWTWQM